MYKEALELCPPGKSSRDISGDPNHRYDHHGSEGDLDDSEPLDPCPHGHPSRDIALFSLALAFGSRYHRFGSVEDLEEEIRLCTESLELCPPGHPRRVLNLSALASALGLRYEHSGSREDAEIDRFLPIDFDSTASMP